MTTLKIRVPPHRYSPLRRNWPALIQPLVTHMNLQVRMNTKNRCIEIRHPPSTENPSSLTLEKASSYVNAFLLGFDLQDAIALLRLDDLYVESFEIREVKRLTGDHLSRCIARLAGKSGKTKFAIENSTRTRIVIADDKIHILGSYDHIRMARHALCSLILGSPVGKVWNRLRNVSNRLKERS